MNFSKYIGLPYKNLGRDFDGVDCYGILFLIFKEERNIILPDFTELKYDKDWYKSENHIIDNIYNWEVVNPPYKVFDGLIFYGGCNNTVANHIGMMINDNSFIHISDKYSSKVDRLSDYWIYRIYKGMRYIG